VPVGKVVSLKQDLGMGDQNPATAFFRELNLPILLEHRPLRGPKILWAKVMNTERRGDCCTHIFNQVKLYPMVIHSILQNQEKM
jgi:hypothetical protein